MQFGWICWFALVIPGFVVASDWPEFRGPTAQGHYEGRLPTRWSATEHIAWKHPIPGLGWSSPVVVNQRVYLTTAVPDDGGHSLRVLCLNAKTGQEVWNREVFRQDASAPRPHSKNSHASPTPVVREGRIYVHFGHQGTACLDLEGNILWQNRELRYSPVHGNGGSPLVAAGLVAFSCDGANAPFLAALDMATGKLRWKTPRSWDFFKKFAFSTPLLIDVEGTKQIVSAGAGGVAGYDPADGREIWKVNFDGYSVVPRPVVGHGLIYVSTSYDTASLLAIRMGGQGNVTDTHIAWTLKRGAPHNPSPVLDGERLFLVSDQGQASCVEARTGKVRWQERVAGAYSASPLLAGGYLYLTNEQGLTSVLKAGDTFEVVSRNAMKERTLASLAAADGAIYLRTESALYKIE